MKGFRWIMVLGLLACAAPMAAPFLALALSSIGDCPPGLGSAAPCVFAGRDWGGTIYQLQMMPWLLIFTIYIAAALIVIWIGVEIVHQIRKRRATPA